MAFSSPVNDTAETYGFKNDHILHSAKQIWMKCCLNVSQNSRKHLHHVYPHLVSAYHKAPSLHHIQPYFEQMTANDTDASSGSISLSAFHLFVKWFDCLIHIIHDLDGIYPSKDLLSRTKPKFGDSPCGTFIIRCALEPNHLKITYSTNANKRKRKHFTLRRVWNGQYTMHGSTQTFPIFAVIMNHRELKYFMTSQGHISKFCVDKNTTAYVRDIYRTQAVQAQGIGIHQSTTSYIHMEPNDKDANCNVSMRSAIHNNMSHLMTVYGGGNSRSDYQTAQAQNSQNHSDNHTKQDGNHENEKGDSDGNGNSNGMNGSNDGDDKKEEDHDKTGLDDDDEDEDEEEDEEEEEEQEPTKEEKTQPLPIKLVDNASGSKVSESSKVSDIDIRQYTYTPPSTSTMSHCITFLSPSYSIGSVDAHSPVSFCDRSHYSNVLASVTDTCIQSKDIDTLNAMDVDKTVPFDLATNKHGCVKDKMNVVRTNKDELILYNRLIEMQLDETEDNDNRLLDREYTRRSKEPSTSPEQEFIHCNISAHTHTKSKYKYLDSISTSKEAGAQKPEAPNEDVLNPPPESKINVEKETSKGKPTSIQDKLLQSLRYRINTQPSMCSDSDESQEMDHWMAVYPSGKDQNYGKAPTQQNNNNKNDNDESDNNRYRNNDNNGNESNDGDSFGSGSGSNGRSDDDDGDHDDDDKGSKCNTQRDHDGDPNEDEEKETDQFIYFMNNIEKYEDETKLRELLASFSDPCIDKVFAGIQEMQNQKIRISNIRQSMKKKKKKAIKTSKSKYKCKSKMKRNMNINIQSFNPFHIKSQYQMHTSFTTQVIPSKIKDMTATDAYDYVLQSLAINQHNCYVNAEDTLKVFNFSLDSNPSNENAYFIAKRQDPMKHRGYEWLVDEVFTKTEISAKYDDIVLDQLPNPMRIDTSYEMKQVEHEIMKLMRMDAKGILMDQTQPQIDILNDTKWHKIHIYNKKNNKRRMELKYINNEFKAHCRAFITQQEELTLFPIIMFDHNDNVCIQYVWVVSMEPNVDIGISFRYNHALESPLAVAGIHLNKDLMYKQHRILCTSQRCQHLAHFTSCINYMRIGNCDDDLNGKKGFKKQMKDLKEKLKESKERSKELERALNEMCRSTSCDSRERSISAETVHSICSNSHVCDSSASSMSLLCYASNANASNRSLLTPKHRKLSNLTVHPLEASEEYPDTSSNQE